MSALRMLLCGASLYFVMCSDSTSIQGFRLPIASRVVVVDDQWILRKPATRDSNFALRQASLVLIPAFRLSSSSLRWQSAATAILT